MKDKLKKDRALFESKVDEIVGYTGMNTYGYGNQMQITASDEDPTDNDGIKNDDSIEIDEVGFSLLRANDEDPTDNDAIEDIIQRPAIMNLLKNKKDLAALAPHIDLSPEGLEALLRRILDEQNKGNIEEDIVQHPSSKGSSTENLYQSFYNTNTAISQFFKSEEGRSLLKNNEKLAEEIDILGNKLHYVMTYMHASQNDSKTKDII